MLKFMLKVTSMSRVPKIVAHSSEGHVVDQFRRIKFLRASAIYELLVTWCGLSHAEDSWETATALDQMSLSW